MSITDVAARIFEFPYDALERIKHRERPFAAGTTGCVFGTFDATRDPKLMVTIGDGGCSGGMFGDSYASCGRVSNVIPVDVAVPGCPATPTAIMQGRLTAIQARSSPPVR